MTKMAGKSENWMKTFIDFAKTFILVAVLPWSIWMTDSIYKLKAFAEVGERFTTLDGELLEARLYSKIMQEVPPEWFREQVQEIKENQDEIQKAINEINTKIKR